MRYLLAVFVLFVLLPFAVMAASAYKMSRPERALIGPPPGDLAVEPVSWRSSRGDLIQGWYVPGRPGRGGVALFHGVRTNRLATLERMRFLNRAGYGVLAIDFQAHGESEGDIITFGKRENEDTVRAIALLRERSDGPVAAIGASLGGAALLVSAAPPAVDAVVLEAVYPTIDEAVGNRFRTWYGDAGGWIAPPFVWTAQWVLGMRRDELRPIDGLRRLTMPVLMMSGVEDTSTTIEETRTMFRALPAGLGELWEVPGAIHGDLHAMAPAEYERRVLAFLERLHAPVQ